MAESTQRRGDATATPFVRKLEIAAAWSAVGVTWCAALLGLAGPRLGGSDPGLEGPIGFAVEVVAALWLPGGVLTASVIVAALLRRLWWPAVALAPIAFVILVPALWVRLRAPTGFAVDNGSNLRVASVNLDCDNEDDPLMAESLRRIDADVLVFLEFTSSWARRLEGWFADDYPHRWLAAAPPSPGLHLEDLRVAVWSRLPAAGAHEVLLLREVNAQIRVPLRWRGRDFALYGIHPWKPYPYPFYAGAWRERQQLLGWIRNERLPTIVAGDFNATPGSAFVLRLSQLGLTNASAAVCGDAPVTWPMRPDARTPLRVAIDHVMHSEAFTATGFRRGATTNSDHAAVVAELAWRD